jgi:hypothetical protein
MLHRQALSALLPPSPCHRRTLRTTSQLSCRKEKECAQAAGAFCSPVALTSHLFWLRYYIAICEFHTREEQQMKE